ncbi:uncharacterized protein MKK02DRAFT_39832 [Dioszegia hungarica]|uniref:Uncharacterized protein n=1 Tax=Dioszegia hungarica TaxID=4972 RepID=A0AA38LZ08_9TREE|nr:uncharacterized protein MKK02DRAFT_39832 [Dioszegia hungarica]KAI9639524.1 hypothetical protein MKK02DRAFT_39832 [Dioszegia hungarica]
MFVTRSSPFSSPDMRGGGSPLPKMQLQMQIQQLKSAPILNPNYGMVQTYLDLLNQLMDVSVSTQGAYGVKIWLIEVQAFTRQLQKRMFQGCPLTPQEKQSVLYFCHYWRNSLHPAYAMAAPEAQIVLIALTEFASL